MKQIFKLAGLFSVFASTPLLAHHPMGGTVPQTLWHGLLSGLGHPVIGLDHLAFVLAVGVVSAGFAQGRWLPLLFLAGGAAGAALHLNGVSLPAGEALVALSVMLIGLAVLFRSRVSAITIGWLFALAGICHGHALTEAIIGAEATPLVAYFAGLVIVQSIIGLAMLTLTRWLTQKDVVIARYALAAFGLMLVASGSAWLLVPFLAGQA